MYLEVSRWMPVHDGEAAQVATDPATWGRWLPIAHAEGGTLDAPDRTAPGSLRLGRRVVPVEWQVVRLVRRTFHLDALRDGEPLARLVLSFSPWDGGCAAELRLDAPGRGGARVLRRALADLERTVDGTAGAVTPDRVRIRRHLVVPARSSRPAAPPGRQRA